MLLAPSVDVTVVIPTIPTRRHMLTQALGSVLDQSMPVRAVVMPLDSDRIGAAANRQRGLDMVNTEWVAFLDDDDLLDREHIEKLYKHAMETGADYVYSWYRVDGGTDPRPEVFGVEFDPRNPVQTTVTTLCRTDVAQEVGGFLDIEDDSAEKLSSPDRHVAGEDWRFTERMIKVGAKIVHLPEVTWTWRHHDQNTSGLPSRW